MNFKKLTCCVLGTLAMFLLAGPVRAAVAPIAHYTFDTNYKDSSPNGNDLTVTATASGTPAITTADVAQGTGAADFNSTTGNQAYLSLTNPITFGASDAWSVVFWAKRRSGCDDRQGMVVGDPSNSTDFIWLSNNGTQVKGLRFRSSTSANANFNVGADDHAYHQWDVIADGAGNVTLYRDDQFFDTVTGTDSSFKITAVGQAYSSNIQSMNGQIDDLYIFDTAIDKPTVDALFAAAPEPATLTLLAFGGLAVIRRRRRSA